ncbi:universal stress protein [Pseudophaeobacter leonis]|uniref:universal stress protein n=1 Tax=Pseudophaeobacter leonis TaxID=1144477 RepID=UPI0013748013|nr:universal stress protein [Pseudophaeobacter leonis]
MISNILVATDGSETAGRAVELAANLAARLDVPMTVGHVLQHGARAEELNRMAEAEHMVRYTATEARLDIADIPSNMDALFTGTLSGADKERALAVMGEEIAARAARRAKEIGAKDVSTRVVNGDYDEGILEMAKDVGADMIVVGQRGLGKLRRIVQGSVSQKVNQQAECTVVTVR